MQTSPTKFDSVYANNCIWNLHLAQIGPPHSQTRASAHAVQAPKGSTSDGWQACTTGKMSTNLSSRRTSELWANSVNKLKVIHYRTSPQSSERWERVRRLYWHFCYRWAPLKFKIRDGLWRNFTSSKTPLVFVNEWVKIHPNVYYRDNLDPVVALPWARRHFGQQQWTRQKDSARAHRANATQ